MTTLAVLAKPLAPNTTMHTQPRTAINFFHDIQAASASALGTTLPVFSDGRLWEPANGDGWKSVYNVLDCVA
jgi:hypothetical protein